MSSLQSFRTVEHSEEAGAFLDKKKTKRIPIKIFDKGDLFDRNK